MTPFLTTGESLLPASQLADFRDLIGRYGQVPMLRLDAEFQAAGDVILPRGSGLRVVHSCIQQMNSVLIFMVVASDVCERATGFHYDGYSV